MVEFSRNGVDYVIKRGAGRHICKTPSRNELRPGNKVEFEIVDLFAQIIPVEIITAEPAVNPSSIIMIAESTLAPGQYFWISCHPEENRGILQILMPTTGVVGKHSINAMPS